MKIVKYDLNNSNSFDFKNISQLLEQGNVFVYPTDTCYGIGGDFSNPNVVNKIISIKQRSINKKFSLIFRDINHIKEYCQVDSKQEAILSKYLPGPYSFILKNKIGDDTISVRIPKYNFTQKLSHIFNNPYISTSANISDMPENYSIQSFLKQNPIKLPDLIVDGGLLPKNLPSTIVDITNPEDPIILRQSIYKFK